MPTQKCEQAGWLHPSRLPLGAGWEGYCAAIGHPGEVPQDIVLRDGCNLGYARCCSWLPAERSWDSIRFAVKRECEDRILVTFVCEADHCPKAHGELEFDLLQHQWPSSHPDPLIQKKADCFLQAYLEQPAQKSDRAGESAND